MIFLDSEKNSIQKLPLYFTLMLAFPFAGLLALNRLLHYFQHLVLYLTNVCSGILILLVNSES